LRLRETKRLVFDRAIWCLSPIFRAHGITLSVTETGANGPAVSPESVCARTPVTIHIPVGVPTATTCDPDVPRCQFSAISSVVDPGIRNITSKYVFGLRLLPENAAVYEPLTLTTFRTKDIPVALGAFAGVSIVATSPAGKLGQGLGAGPVPNPPTQGL
jgi:hypothetical protein